MVEGGLERRFKRILLMMSVRGSLLFMIGKGVL